jgi:sugar lactone lactonase YvrE
MDVFDERRCDLGEGAFWHPERQQFFWFDIVNKRLLSQEQGAPVCWSFEESVSAAAWISIAELLIASETGLWRLDLATDRRECIVALPAAPELRSNDGRADPWGGFWFGMMGKKSEQAAGAIWRYYRGELRKLYGDISIPNALCFDGSRSRAYFSDTRLRQIWQVRLDAQGWPAGDPELFLDITASGFSPDGAVVDAEGNLWNAQWGASHVACYSPEGRQIAVERFAAAKISCPAFGGTDLQTLFVTSACLGMSEQARAAEPHAGMTFARRVEFKGIAEPQVIL